MVLVTLRFDASGCMMVVVADFAGVHKSTACRIIHKMSHALVTLCHIFIEMPRTYDEMRNAMREFYEISRFPTCIRSLDCTHMKIQSPGGMNAGIFRNHKGYFCSMYKLYAMLICISEIVCRLPGSSHDFTIFNNSNLERNLDDRMCGNTILVADSGYSLKNI